MTKRLEVIGFSFCKISNVSLVSEDSALQQASVTFVSGFTWIPLKLTIGTMNYEEARTLGDVGTVYLKKFSGSLPGKSNSGQLALRELFTEPVLVRLECMDGTILLIGNIDDPVKLLEKTIHSSNEFIITFEHESAYGSFELV